jgi:hypothetical protein
MTTLTGSGLLALAVAASSRLRPHGGPRILMRISKPSAGARMRRRWREARWRELEAAALVWSQSRRALTLGLREPVSSPVYPEQPRKYGFRCQQYLAKVVLLKKRTS